MQKTKQRQLEIDIVKIMAQFYCPCGRHSLHEPQKTLTSPLLDMWGLFDTGKLGISESHSFLVAAFH